MQSAAVPVRVSAGGVGAVVVLVVEVVALAVVVVVVDEPSSLSKLGVPTQ